MALYLIGYGVYGESVSAFPICIHVGIFSFALCVEVSQLVSGFFQKQLLHGQLYIVASEGGGDFRSILCVR